MKVRAVKVESYISDYTGEQRHAVRVFGKCPPSLDFETLAEAHAAKDGAEVMADMIENGEGS